MLKPPLVEAIVVEAIKGAIAAASPSVPCVVSGFWQPSLAGSIKRGESPDTVAFVNVATSLGNQPTFSDPNVTLTVAVTLAVRCERDAQSNALPAIAAAIDALFRDWQRRTYQDTFTDLDVDGLSIDELGINAGDPTVNFAAKVATIPWRLSLSGVFNPENPQPTT